MFDIGWSEMAIIMLLALIIIGPKDLPRVARTIGQWVRKGRALAREFQTSLEDMARDTELDDVRKEIEKVGRTDFKKSIEKTIDPKGDLTKAFDTSDKASDKAKPALTDRDALTGMDALTDKTASSEKSNGAAKRPVNGHAGDVTPPPSEPPPSEKSAQDASSTSSGAGTATAKASETKAAASKPASPASTSRPASKSKAASKPAAAKPRAKPRTAKKPAATRKTASSTAERPARSATSRAKTGAAKNGVEPSPTDDGDNSAAAAKPS